MFVLHRQALTFAIALIAASSSTASAWINSASPQKYQQSLTTTSMYHRDRVSSFLRMINDDDDDDTSSNDDDETPPGKMRISEIKSELKLRDIPFSDCFDRESLERRLLSARSTGMSDPSIVDKFNKNNLEATFKGEKIEVPSDEDISKVVGGDGTLPGGMPPEMLKELMSNPELMELLQSTKMQEAMKLMMTGGQEALQKAMEDDQETYEVVMKLNEVMAKGGAGGSGGAPPPPPPSSDAFQ